MKNIIRKELDKILLLCRESDISIFDGEFDNENQQQVVSWTNEEEQSYLKFITMIKKIGAKVLIVSSSESELEISSLNEIDSFNNLENDEKEYAKHLFSEVDKNSDDLLYYSLAIIINSTIYKFTKFANWAESYFELTELIESSREMDLEKVKEGDNIELFNYGRKLANTPLFQKSRNKSQREYATRHFMDNITQKIGFHYRVDELTDVADSIYKLEIEPELTNFTKQHAVYLYKNKIPKSKIVLILSINSNELNSILSKEGLIE